MSLHLNLKCFSAHLASNENNREDLACWKTSLRATSYLYDSLSHWKSTYVRGQPSIFIQYPMCYDSAPSVTSSWSFFLVFRVYEGSDRALLECWKLLDASIDRKGDKIRIPSASGALFGPTSLQHKADMAQNPPI